MSVINRLQGSIMRNKVLIGSTLILLTSAWASGQGWMNYDNQTSVRLQADPSVGVNDDRENCHADKDDEREGDGDDDMTGKCEAVGDETEQITEQEEGE